jgi:CRP-like cAMP-binding protein
LKVIKKHNTEYEDAEMISECLSKHFVLRCLDKRARQEISKEMTLCSIEQGAEVYKQGLSGSYFYIVKDGTLEYYRDNIKKYDVNRGESIGELALIHSAPRDGTLKAKTKTLVWCLERKNFKKIVDVINKMNHEENKQFLSSIRMLSAVDTELKSILANNLLKQHYAAGQTIFNSKF